MKLYIKQKAFSWRDRFAIKDENGNERWHAQGELLSIGRKLHVYGADGEEAAFIRQKVISLLTRYYIEIGETEHEFVKELTFLKPKYAIRDMGWTAAGNFLEHEFAVSDGSGEIMRMSKAWLTWGDYYELDIYEPQNELLCLCVALAIDCANEDEDTIIV